MSDEPTTQGELWKLDATRQVGLVASGEVSCRELVDAHLRRIDRLNPQLGAATVTLFESARASADAADRGAARGPLCGLPFTVKQDVDCLGSPTTRGVPALRDALPYADAPLVARLRAAGAIPIARTNLSEMGLRLCTENPLHGRTLSPWDRRLSVGGSSGGDAVAVITGMTPLGVGGDSGGSLRVPAACCGCLALKPTTGRIAHASSLPPHDHALATQLMLALGPLARSVADLRLVLRVAAGRDARDPWSVDAPLQGPEAEPVAAIVTSLPGGPLPESALTAVRRAAGALEAAGFQVEEAVPPELSAVDDVFANLLESELSPLVDQLRPVISERLASHLARLCGATRGRRLSPTRLFVERSRLMRAWSGFFSDYSVVVGPGLGTSLFPVDADLHPERGIEFSRRLTRFVTPGNALGIPSLAQPVGLVDDLPAGVLIYADRWREDLCLRAAEAIEAECGAPAAMDPRWS